MLRSDGQSIEGFRWGEDRPLMLRRIERPHDRSFAIIGNSGFECRPVGIVWDRQRGRNITAAHDVLACGPEPMLEAVRQLTPRAQLAWEAPMACGYGACYGCVVEIDGELKRLCVEGPVLCFS